MADREVKRSGKDNGGDITKLCNSAEGWSPRVKRDAIEDIESNTHAYFVRWNGGERTEIEVINGSSGKYLRTDRDSTSKNNLDDLPDC